MATINLGNIKFNWQGAYAGGTAYAIDDVVSYNGSSYICKLASTGNLPTNTTYWDQMSSAGTNGTDLTSTLTTQGDLVYRDGSGLQRLGAGTAGQVLQTGGAGANPSWGTLSSDMVKLVSGSHSGSNLIMDNLFEDSSTYSQYQVHINYAQIDGSFWMRGRTGGASGSTYSSSDHWYRSYMFGLYSNGSPLETGEGGYNDSKFRIGWTNTTGTNGDSYKITIPNPNNTSYKLQYFFDNTFSSSGEICFANGAGVGGSASTEFTGLVFSVSTGNSFTCDYIVYGLKA